MAARRPEAAERRVRGALIALAVAVLVTVLAPDASLRGVGQALAQGAAAPASVPLAPAAPAPKAPATPPETGRNAPAGQPRAPGEQRRGATQVKEITMAELGALSDIALTGVVDQSEVLFGLPDHWELDAAPELHLQILRSSVLLPDVSLIAVHLDDRPLATIRLDGPETQPRERVVPLPIGLAKGVYHTLQFRAYHRSLLPCEIDDHPGLWSKVLSESTLKLTYHEIAPKLSLSKWPYPFRDEKDRFPHPLVLVLRPNPSVEEIQAIGYLTSVLATTARWRPLHPIVHVGSLATAPPGNVIELARSDVEDTLDDLLRLLDLGGVESQRTAGTVRAHGWPGAGIIVLSPRLGSPLDTVLTVAGKDGRGLVELALLLSGKSGRSLPTGTIQRVQSVKAAEPMEARRWLDTAPPEATFSLKDQGQKDRTVTGVRSGVVEIPLRLIPDEVAVAGKARIDLVYSYGAQLDPERARVDVILNNARVGGAPLAAAGASHARLSVELPASEIGPESRLYISFVLAPKHEVCVGSRPVPNWGTVHAETVLTVPRERVVTSPNLALLRFGGFPFSLGPDYASSRIVLTTRPSAQDLQMFAWWTTELGRVSRGDRFAYRVSLGSDKGAGDDDLLVIDSGPDAGVLKQFSLLDRMSFAVDEDRINVAFTNGSKVSATADPSSAYLEALSVAGGARPRAAVVSYAVRAEAFTKLGNCVTGHMLDNLQGRVARVGSCTDLSEIATAVEPKAYASRPVATVGDDLWKSRGWKILLGVVAIALAGFFFRRWHRRRNAP